MGQRRIDPESLDGEELNRWYRQSSDERERVRNAAEMERYRAFFGASAGQHPTDIGESGTSETSAVDGDAGWQEARVTVRPPIFAVRPGDVRIGVSPVAGADAVGPAGGFFATYKAVPNPAWGPAYITNLPSPLNIVTPRLSGWFELGDGSLVKGVDEVERIHAEQQRRMRGEEDAEPAPWVHSEDRLKDGFIPNVAQIEKGQREEDATCHPNGGWERDPGFASNSLQSQRYETQITHAQGLDYVVRNPGEKPVKFDGCAVWDPNHQLLEAKGPGYAPLLDSARKSTFFGALRRGSQSQADRQAAAAGGGRVDWHVAEPGAISFFADLLSPHPSMRLRQTPAR